jgi:hypothetical protein
MALFLSTIDENFYSEQWNEAILFCLLLAETETVAMETNAIIK